MASAGRSGGRAHGAAPLVAGLLLLVGAGAHGWSAAVGGESALPGTRRVESALEPTELLRVAFRLRHGAACLGFGTSRTERPAGELNAYELGLSEAGSPLWLPQRLSFFDNPGANDAFHRSVPGARVFDGLERGEHAVAWSALKASGADADLTVGRSELAVVCAKRELPWRDEGELPRRTSSALGGFTGPDAEVSSFGHFDPLVALSFVAARTLQCLAVASGNALNPSNGAVDQRYELALSRAGEVAGFPVQRVEHDDDPLLHEPASLPVAAVRFFPDVPPGPQTFTWWGIQREGGTDVMTVEVPTLAVACTRERLGAAPFAGRAAAGGAHRAGPVELTGGERDLVELAFSLRRRSRCAAFASAWATNPAGGTLDNVYRFRLASGLDVPGWDMLLEFDDNEGVDDAGVLPIAHAGVFDLERGEHVLRFQVQKDGGDDADLTVSSPSLAVFCARKGL